MGKMKKAMATFAAGIAFVAGISGISALFNKSDTVKYGKTDFGNSIVGTRLMEEKENYFLRDPEGYMLYNGITEKFAVVKGKDGEIEVDLLKVEVSESDYWDPDMKKSHFFDEVVKGEDHLKRVPNTIVSKDTNKVLDDPNIVSYQIE